MTFSSFRFYDYIINIVLKFLMHHVVENGNHRSLIRNTHILKSKWHHDIIEIHDSSTKCGICCVSWCHFDLIVTAKNISRQHLIFSLFFFMGTIFESHCGCSIGLINPAANNFLTFWTILASMSRWNCRISLKHPLGSLDLFVCGELSPKFMMCSKKRLRAITSV